MKILLTLQTDKDIEGGKIGYGETVVVNILKNPTDQIDINRPT